MALTRLPVVGHCIGLCLLSVCLVIAFSAHGAFADEQYPEAVGDPSSGQSPHVQPESDSSVYQPAGDDFDTANNNLPQVPTGNVPEVLSATEDDHEHAASRPLSEDKQAAPEDSVMDDEAGVGSTQPLVKAAGSDAFQDDDAPDGNSSFSSSTERRRLSDATLAPEGILQAVDPVGSEDPGVAQTVLPLGGGLDNTSEESLLGHMDEKSPAPEAATEGGQQDAQTPADATEAGSLRRRLGSGAETQTDAENETDSENSNAVESAFGSEDNELLVDSEAAPSLVPRAPTEESNSSPGEGSRRRLTDNEVEAGNSEDHPLQTRPSLRGATGAQQTSDSEQDPKQECAEELAELEILS